MPWKRICAVNDVPENGFLRVVVDDIPVVVVNLGDHYSVIPPLCPHMESPLDETGVCADGQLTCTTHLWQWDLKSGTPTDPDENQRQLLLYPSKREGNDILAEIEYELEYEFEEDEESEFEW